MIIPSIDLRGGHAVQLVGGKELKIDAGDPRPFAESFRLAGEIAVVDLDAALSTGTNKETILDLIKMAPCRVGGGIRDVDTALFWLNAGATKIVLGTAAVPEVLSKLPRERVIAALDAVHGEVVVHGWTTKTGKNVKERIEELKPYVAGFLVTFVEREGRMQGVDMNAIKELAEAVGKDAKLTVAGGVTTLDDIAQIDKLGVDAQVGMALYTNSIHIGDAISCTLKSDRPDGLFPTVVVDESGVALGLVYSSKESIKEAARLKRGVYYSRSRNEIWYKGDTSGDSQQLLRIEVDCDRDALQFVVKQEGSGFCHRKTRSCFTELDAGLGGLTRVLQSRLLNAPEGSYTKRLFRDDNLLKAKLVEEAHELADAKTKEEATCEAADVIYFALVAATKHGATLADIERELDRRSLKVARRPGDAKPNIVNLIQQKEKEEKEKHDKMEEERKEAEKEDTANPIHYLRPDLSKLEQYTPIKPLEVLAAEIGIPVEKLVKLDANENLYGPIPEVKQAISTSNLHIYPDPSQTYLREALSKYTGAPVNSIIAGSGSDDIIDILMRIVDPETIVISTPTFGMYSFLGKINKSKILDIPRTAGSFDLDFGALRATFADEKKLGCPRHRALFFAASPNNPTGNALSTDDVASLCSLGCIVVLDEAYAEFCHPSWKSALTQINRFPNLVVLRTFSKWAGLAGLRVGYGVAHPTITEWMMSIKQPYNVNAAADVAAVAALQNIEKVMVTVDLIKKEKVVMLQSLSEFKWLVPLPSDSNFVIFHVIGVLKASEVAFLLRKAGVFVRYFSTATLRDYIRISVGRPEDTNTLVNVLRNLQNTWKLLDIYDPQALLLDMDGVIADVSQSYRQAIVQAAAHYGVIVTNHDITEAKAAGNANNDWILSLRLIEAAYAKVGRADVPSLQDVTKVFEDLYQGTPEKPGLRLTEGLLIPLHILQRFHARVPLAIVTGRPRFDAMTFLNTHNIAGLFRHVVCMEDGPAKPDPTPVRLALQQLGIQRALMVGDTPDDIRSAVAAGVLGIGVLSPGEKLSPDNGKIRNAILGAGASKIVESVEELLVIYEKVQQQHAQ